MVLKSLLKLKERPKFLSIELLTPNNLGRQIDALDILCHLKVLGFSKFYISDQSKNNLVKCPQPCIEGKYVDFSFDGASSGLFGKELEGPWLSIDKIAGYYLNFFYKKRFYKNIILNKLIINFNRVFKINKENIFHAGGWFDVHAKME